MKNKWIVCLLILLVWMGGCAKIPNERMMLEDVKAKLDGAVTSEISSSVNTNKGFISFYLEPSIGRTEANKTNSVFLIDGEHCVLTVDVPAIVTAKYYSSDNPDLVVMREIDAFPNQIFEKEGTFLSGGGLVREYRCRIYRLDQKNYGVMIQTSNIILVAECPLAKTGNMTASMMRIARTIRCDEEQVVSAYSQKEMINYRKEVLDIFQKIYPENGSLLDMLEDDTDNTKN